MARVVNNICVYASPEHTKPVAIIVPAEPALKKVGQAVGAKGTSLEELVHDRKVQNAVLKELQAAGKAGGLSGIEIIDGIILADEEWTAENVSCTISKLLMSKLTICSLGISYRCSETYSQEDPGDLQETSR